MQFFISRFKAYDSVGILHKLMAAVATEANPSFWSEFDQLLVFGLLSTYLCCSQIDWDLT